MDGDGDLDAFVSNYIKQPNRIWLNDGVGNFTDSGQTLGNLSSLDVDLGDKSYYTDLSTSTYDITAMCSWNSTTFVTAGWNVASIAR